MRGDTQKLIFLIIFKYLQKSLALTMNIVSASHSNLRIVWMDVTEIFYLEVKITNKKV
jgi:hypothetical protein